MNANYHWWRDDVLRDLLVLKHAIQSLDCPPEVTDFFYLALAGVLVPDLTNVKIGRLNLAPVDRTGDNIQVWHTFEQHAFSMISDLSFVRRLSQERAHVFLLDSMNLPKLDIPDIYHVITSPPYPNGYDYISNTRPHLEFFDFIRSSEDAEELCETIIGDPTSAATSLLAKENVGAEFDAVEQHILPVAEDVRRHDRVLAGYLVGYFNDISRQLVGMVDILGDGAKLAYVVGQASIEGVHIQTDLLLAQVMENLPFDVTIDEIRRIRRIGSQQTQEDLYESIVYAHVRQGG